MKNRRSELDDESSWIISSIILAIITIILYILPFLEKTFLLYIFVIPTLISIGYSIYLKIRRR
ncbi:MAG: hypothetical protein DRN47_00105 [Candidatus Wolframiiraptor sp.]|nr:MAG: hypothetical protein DRN47_00105 [Candidatus Wolframiiraptor sp.]